jgi:hypothetical protein
VGNEQALYNPTKRVGLVQNGHYLHLMVYRTLVEHANHHTTDAVYILTMIKSMKMCFVEFVQ